MTTWWLTVALLLCAAANGGEQLGMIVFPNSGKPEAQPAFLRGVLLLHDFAYPQAQRAGRPGYFWCCPQK